jgi:hypothetical protein
MLKDAKPRGIRNKNPMNIRENDNVDFDWVGESILDIDPEFEEFKDVVFGIRAGSRILKTYREKYGLTSVSGIINKWAPPVENDTQSYIKSVASKIGKDEHEPLQDSDYVELISAMIYHENGQQPYSEDVIEEGFQMGFYS